MKEKWGYEKLMDSLVESCDITGKRTDLDCKKCEIENCVKSIGYLKSRYFWKNYYTQQKRFELETRITLKRTPKVAKKKEFKYLEKK